MSIKLGATSVPHVVTSDLVSDMTDLACLKDEIFEGFGKLDELDMVMSNMTFAIESLKQADDPKKVMKILDLGVSCENLLGVAADKIEAKAAMEGITDAIKKAWDTLVEWCKKIWAKIKEWCGKLLSFFGSTKNNILDRCKKIRERISGAKEGLSVALEGTSAEEAKFPSETLVHGIIYALDKYVFDVQMALHECCTNSSLAIKQLVSKSSQVGDPIDNVDDLIGGACDKFNKIYHAREIAMRNSHILWAGDEATTVTIEGLKDASITYRSILRFSEPYLKHYCSPVAAKEWTISGVAKLLDQIETATRNFDRCTEKMKELGKIAAETNFDTIVSRLRGSGSYRESAKSEKDLDKAQMLAFRVSVKAMAKFTAAYGQYTNKCLLVLGDCAKWVDWVSEVLSA